MDTSNSHITRINAFAKLQCVNAVIITYRVNTIPSLEGIDIVAACTIQHIITLPTSQHIIFLTTNEAVITVVPIEHICVLPRATHRVVTSSTMYRDTIIIKGVNRIIVSCAL